MIGPTTSARLAAAVAATIRDHAALGDAQATVLATGSRSACRRLDDAVQAFNRSFDNLKTTFEQEFPHGQD